MIPGLFIYIYILLGFLVLLFDTQKRSPKQYLKIFNVVFVVLAMLAAFSYGVGNDTLRYSDYFHDFSKLNELEWGDFQQVRYQPLYVIICSICRTIYDDLFSFQLVQITLLYHSLYLVLRKLDLRKFWVLFLFFGYCYTALLSGRRECIGLAFCLYAMLFYMDNKWIPYYALVFCGFMCHSGMIIFAAFPLIKLLKGMSIWNVLIIFVVVYLIQFILGYLEMLGMLLSLDEEDSLMRYGQMQEEQLKFTTIILILVQLAIFIWFAVKKNERNLTGYSKDFIYIGILFVVLGFLSAAMPIMYRYRVHFAVFSYFTLRECFKSTKRNTLLIAMFFVVFSYSPVSTFVNAMKTSNASYYYCSVFSSNEAKEQMNVLRQRQ